MWNADFPTKFQKFLPIYFRTKSSNILVFFIFSNEFASFPIFSNTKISSVQCHSLAWLSSPIVSPNKKALVVTIEGVQSRDLGVRTCTLVCKSCCSFVLSTYRTMKSEVRAPPKSSIGLVKQTHKGHFDCRAAVSSEPTYRTACRRKAAGLWPGLRTGVSYTSYY